MSAAYKHNNDLEEPRMRTAMAFLLLVLVIGCGEDPPITQAAIQPAQVPPPNEAPRPMPQAAIVTEQPPPSPDVVLSARVKKALDDGASDLSPGIDVAASSGVVRLFGTVPNNEARSKVQKIASSTPGVTSVDNKLVVVKGS
jgi:hypothetical protein